MSLDPQSAEPLYRQLFDQIVDRIRSGTFPAGYRLSPTREPAGEKGANRNTVGRAYEDLEGAGFVPSTVGRGTCESEPKKGAKPAAGVPPVGLPWGSLL